MRVARNHLPDSAPEKEAGMAFHILLDVHCSPSEVFAFVADFRNMPRWYEAVEQVTATTSALFGTGTRFHMIRSLPGGLAHNDVEVTSCHVDKEITFTSVSGPTPFQYRYRFEPISNGTKLTLDGEISAAGLPGLAGHVGGDLASQIFKQGMRKNLEMLKRIIEA
jgi:Polyketide cyclase / dehydrase and lipid transport